MKNLLKDSVKIVGLIFIFVLFLNGEVKAENSIQLPCTDPTPEVFDCQDNDCDHQVDEDLPPEALVCTVGVGACAAEGTLSCDIRRLVCDAVEGEPTAEVCNGIDDDCNGAIDDGIECINTNTDIPDTPNTPNTSNGSGVFGGSHISGTGCSLNPGEMPSPLFWGALSLLGFLVAIFLKKRSVALK